MTGHRRDTARQRHTTGGETGTKDRVDPVERASEASFPASDAPDWTPVIRIGMPGAEDGSASRGVAPRAGSGEAATHAAPIDIRLKRVYASPAAEDGVRILVDRLWPRGLTKREAAIDRWLRDLAPSTELRRWFGHDPSRWDEFQRRYGRELREQGELLKEVRSLARRRRVTLLFGAHDEQHNNAVALREFLLV
jgi:uncharacterized protein YeaO (DUF488 family)